MKETFRALNGLRFFAALSVVLFHYSGSVSAYRVLPIWATNVVQCGPAALGFFFILSGFVLAHANPSLSDRRSRALFWSKRFARLYPTYLFAFVFFLPIAVEKYLLHPTQIANSGNVRTFVFGALLSSTLLQAWTPLSQAWNGPSWSLSVEAFFYLMFPFVLPQLSRLRLRTLLLVCGVGWAAMVGVTFVETQAKAPNELWTGFLRNSPLLWCPMFIIGVSLARLIPLWSHVRPIIADLVCTLSAAGILFACAFCPLRYQELLITGGLAWPLAAMVLAYSHRCAALSRVLGNRIFDALGRVSYITYIIQAPLWHFFNVGSNKFLHRSSWSTSVTGWQFVAYLTLLVCSSFLVEAFVEQPCRTSLTRYFTRLANRGANGNTKPTNVETQHRNPQIA
jgi:peptidoglycan/LPS O-acetylase OafA/YrhL